MELGEVSTASVQRT